MLVGNLFLGVQSLLLLLFLGGVAGLLFESVHQQLDNRFAESRLDFLKVCESQLNMLKRNGELDQLLLASASALAPDPDPDPAHKGPKKILLQKKDWGVYIFFFMVGYVIAHLKPLL